MSEQAHDAQPVRTRRRRNTRRTRAMVSALVEELTIGAAKRLRANADDIRPIVIAVVDYLREAYPAQDLYIPAAEVKYPVRELRQAVDSGQYSIREICRQFRISRKTLYWVLARPLDLSVASRDAAECVSIPQDGTHTDQEHEGIRHNIGRDVLHASRPGSP